MFLSYRIYTTNEKFINLIYTFVLFIICLLKGVTKVIMFNAKLNIERYLIGNVPNELSLLKFNFAHYKNKANGTY